MRNLFMNAKIIFVILVCIILVGFDKSAYDNSGLLYINFNGGDLYYDDGGRTACLPTDKLKLVLLKLNSCESDYSMLKVDYDTLKRTKDLELKTCYDKCNNELNIYKGMCSECNKTDWIKSSLLFLSGIGVGVLASSLIFLIKF